MNIIITDSTGAITVIGAGAAVSRKKITEATQIEGWKATNHVRKGGKDNEAAPFGAAGGECLYDTSALFCFAGAKNKEQTNVLLVLWSFPARPTTRFTGRGQLSVTIATGMMAQGAITWEINPL
jgi:hypothetical protein